ncbi:MAG: hypothetical protein F2667_14615 [Actinobacteria bacterium]|uniref:Unannotated protein n=1 Tax=freshwater metagenome TaxID=449393 RepID=A0A6J6SI74_9ZZZZ|nr:hypothetical protein [Actinomycetota bacterium]
MYIDRSSLGLIEADSCFKAWQVTLDRIELDVMRAERDLGRGEILHTDPWDLPADYGPLPDELRERAEEILARQHALIEEMTGALGYTVRQRAVADAVGRVSTRGLKYPIYVDVSA